MRVIDHRSTLILEGCSFVIQEGGRRRALFTRQRNVHAFIKGEPIEAEALTSPRVRNALRISTAFFNEDAIIKALHEKRKIVQVTYNHNKYDAFVQKETEKPIYRAQYVMCLYPKVWAII